MQYTINEFRKEAFKEVYQVYKVFQDFFGEDSVDLQGLPDDDIIAFRFNEHDIPMREDGSCYEANGNSFNSVIRDFSNARPFILVYWPRVRVTNENDKSIIIQDLYAKIELDAKGCIPTEDHGFQLNRATYPMEQWVYGYMHSHISTIPKSNLTSFQSPCLGTGPIIQTINSLRANISEGFDETKWMLFCHELSLYVTVESLAGIPYNHLENVHLNSVLSSYGKYDENYGVALNMCNRVSSLELKEFILYYIHNGHLAINYQNGVFKVGMSYFDYMIDISNSFIEYFNTHFDNKHIAQQCFDHCVLYHSIASNGHFFDPNTSDTIPDVSQYVGKKICIFKGRDVTLRIMEPSKEEPQKTTVLNHGLAMYILNNILKIINYRYTNEYTRQHCQGSTAALPATTGQRVYYI
jgi:hypothetical protein